MTEKEILEYNKRCAEFLGKETKVYTDTPTLTWYRFNNGMLLTKDMKFHSDWNWIHEIKEAIVKLGYFFISNPFIDDETNELSGEHFCVVTYKSNNIKSPYFIDVVGCHSEKEAVVEAINQFLIWHKEK